MIITASRRTDIPAFFSEWFLNRIKDKYLLVRNPMNDQQVSRIDLSPEVVDGIVFVTKNPVPMLSKLDQLKDYAYYFQFTITSYGSDVEPYVPSKNDVIIPAFQRLSDMLGPERVIWRYDPIFLSTKYSLHYHIDYFDKIAEKLEGCTEKCVISFIDYYSNTRSNMKDLDIIDLTLEDIEFMAKHLSASAQNHGLKIETCAENIDLEKYHISHGRCIDEKLFEKHQGFSLKLEKAKPQRACCGCAPSLDVGAYSTCSHGCKYCYANFNLNAVLKRSKTYDPASPILCDALKEGDKVSRRVFKSNKRGQLSLFE